MKAIKFMAMLLAAVILTLGATSCSDDATSIESTMEELSVSPQSKDGQTIKSENKYITPDAAIRKLKPGRP